MVYTEYVSDEGRQTTLKPGLYALQVVAEEDQAEEADRYAERLDQQEENLEGFIADEDEEEEEAEVDVGQNGVSRKQGGKTVDEADFAEEEEHDMEL